MTDTPGNIKYYALHRNLLLLAENVDNLHEPVPMNSIVPLCEDCYKCTNPRNQKKPEFGLINNILYGSRMIAIAKL
jgi:hypothetical protein